MGGRACTWCRHRRANCATWPRPPLQPSRHAGPVRGRWGVDVLIPTCDAGRARWSRPRDEFRRAGIELLLAARDSALEVCPRGQSSRSPSVLRRAPSGAETQHLDKVADPESWTQSSVMIKPRSGSRSRGISVVASSEEPLSAGARPTSCGRDLPARDKEHSVDVIAHNPGAVVAAVPRGPRAGSAPGSRWRAARGATFRSSGWA